MFHIRSFTGFLNAPWVLKCFKIDLINRISSERNVKQNFGTSKFARSEGSLGDVLRTSWGLPESTFQWRPLNERLGRSLDVISGRSQDVRLGRPPDGQIGSLGEVLGTFEGDGKSWWPIFAGWDVTFQICNCCSTKISNF